jgi:excisionase family DNA binding protein
MADELMTVRDVARACGRSEETVRRWIWTSKLPATKLGNQLFVRREDLEAMLAPRTGEAKALYKAPTKRPTLFEQYDYSPLQEMMAEHRGRYVPSADQEAEQIVEDEAFQSEVEARSGKVDVIKLLARDD